jgi:hypothetical protein
MTDTTQMDKIEKLLDRLSCKETVIIDIIGRCDDNGILIQQLPRTIHLKPDVSHQIALQSLESTSFFPNLTKENNKFYYTITNSTVEHVIEFLPGAYQIEDYNLSLQRSLIAKGHCNNQNVCYIKIDIDTATCRTIITLSEGYKVYFNKPNTWRKCLGFNARNLTTNGTHISDDIVSIVPIQKIYMSCNLCAGSISSDSVINKGDILFSFPNSKKFGYPLILAPNNLGPRQLITKSINTIQLRFFSNDDAPVNFMGKMITGEIVITQV